MTPSTTPSLADKRILVTGAGSGIGYGLCRALAAAGAHVALNDSDPALAHHAADTINAAVDRPAVTPYPFDVADVAALRRAVDAVVARHGGLDGAVANAGITNFGEFLDYTLEAFDRLTAVNLRGSYFTAQAAARAMIAGGNDGRIVLLSSVTGVQAYANLSAYGITKAGIRMMARVLAVELGRYSITVNALTPGATVTERTLRDDPHYAEHWDAVTPTGRVSTVDDVVAAALFLLSDGARQVTGQTLVVDGGWTLVSPIPAETPDKPDFSSRLR